MDFTELSWAKLGYDRLLSDRTVRGNGLAHVNWLMECDQKTSKESQVNEGFVHDPSRLVPASPSDEYGTGSGSDRVGV